MKQVAISELLIKMNLNMTMSVDLNKVEEFVNSDKLAEFLLDNTADFSVAGYILTAIFDRLEADKLTLN